jgi:hypothetical protein
MSEGEYTLDGEGNVNTTLREMWRGLIHEAFFHSLCIILEIFYI